MTLVDFISLQGQLVAAFGWFIRWWLIGLLAGGVFATLLVFTIVTTRETLSKI